MEARDGCGVRCPSWTSSCPAGTARTDSGGCGCSPGAGPGPGALGLIRDPEQAGVLEAVGAEPVVCDMEALDDLSGCCEGGDAVVFAAGAGPGRGGEGKRAGGYGGAG